MAIIGIIIYLSYIFSILGYVILIRLRLIQHRPLEPITYVILGLSTLSLGLVSLAKGNFCSIDILGLMPLGVGIFSIGIALFALGLSEESNRNIRRTMRYFFNDIMDKIREIRKDLFDYFDELRQANRFYRDEMTEFDLMRLRRRIEFATWDTFSNIRSAMALVDEIEPEDQRRLIRSLLFLSRNLLTPRFIRDGILINRHVEHLLMSTRVVLDFDVINEFEIEFLNLFSRYIGGMDDRHRDFGEYVQRKINQLKRRNLNEMFEPFDIEE